MDLCKAYIQYIYIPSRELTYPILEKGNSLIKSHFFWDFLSSQEGVHIYVYIYIINIYIIHQSSSILDFCWDGFMASLALSSPHATWYTQIRSVGNGADSAAERVTGISPVVFFLKQKTHGVWIIQKVTKRTPSQTHPKKKLPNHWGEHNNTTTEKQHEKNMKNVSALFRKKNTPILVSQKTSPFRNPGSATRSVGHVNIKPVVRSLPWRCLRKVGIVDVLI